jgi:CheY-like chemotaxis protein
MLRFLIVDDDEDDRELFCTALEDVDPTIHCAFAIDGEDALNGLRCGRLSRPDLIFLDLNMPRLNGVRTLIELKKDRHLKDIPVVIHSTSNQERDKEQTAIFGAIGFITKPNCLSDLEQAIAQILNDQFNIIPK